MNWEVGPNNWWVGCGRLGSTIGGRWDRWEVAPQTGGIWGGGLAANTL